MELNLSKRLFYKLFYVICILIFLFPNIGVSLHITNIVVPQIVDVRDTATLSCSYNLYANKLNSVKWYKDNSEFFRYAPLMPTKQIMKFDVDGVQLSSDHVCNKQFCTIHLENLSRKTTGSYRCEISGDWPEFKLSHEESNLTVAVLPRHDPVIYGLEKTYYESDILQGNCSTDMSFPGPSVMWYINDHKAPSDILQPVLENTIDAYGFNLTFRSLEIKFRIDKTRFPFIHDGRLHLKCISQIKQIPQQIRESDHLVYVAFLDDMRNQKHMNYKSSANTLNFCLSKNLTAIHLFLIYFVIKIFNNAITDDNIINRV